MITAQVVGLPLKYSRLGKWHYPKMFPDPETFWEYFETWWTKVLELSMSVPREIPPTRWEGASILCYREFNMEPHLTSDLMGVFRTPDERGLILVKSAIR